MKNFFLITMLLIVTTLQSCNREPYQNEKSVDKGKLSIKLDTRALELSGTSISKVRIIAYNKSLNKIKLNTTSLTDQSTVTGEAKFFISIPLGDYSFYAIVNEPANLTTALNNVDSEEALNLIKIQPSAPFTETTVMLVKKKDAVIAINSSEETTVDGSTDPLKIELERAYTKVSLTINKATVDAGDKFVISKVDLVQMPVYSYLNAKVYDGSTYASSREIFKGEIEFTNNGDEHIIVKENTTGTLDEPSNIFAEYLLSETDKSTHDKATYLGILAKYTPAGASTHEVYYKIPVGDYKGNHAADAAGHDYNLKRNHHYAINAKITKMGEKDAVEVKYTVEPWKNEGLNVEFEGDPFLDVTNVEVDVYDAAATRIYFYSNMPTVEIDPMLLNGTQLLLVNDIFESLSGVTPNNFKYTYNPDTKKGEGYFDLINIHTSSSVRQQRKLYLKSGKLVREITATTLISAEAEKENTQPFIGTFHRYLERGERIVSWHLPTTAKWKVEVVTDASFDGGINVNATYYKDAAFLRIDRLASPNHSKLYTLEPPSAEGSFVSEDIEGSVKAPITKIEGQGRVYFRVGWSAILNSATALRFAKIKVTTSTDNFTTSNVSYLYCRQGEEPSPIISNTTIFASYNISTPETFVNFPTQSGHLYQWNRTVPWAVTGAVNNYTKGDVANTAINNGYEYKTYINESYICPSKYSYPDNQALTVMEGALDIDRVMYQWGYYADGFFDRRAVSDHIVRNALGEVASAGGLFSSEITAIAIFLPTVSWRDYKGEINSLTPHQQLGVIGHYWSWAQDGEWVSGPGSGTPVLTATLEAKALHLTQKAEPDSYIESLNKASAASVRCMRLEGKTVYFDSNGGLITPRSMTVSTGDITFPQGPLHSDPALEFVNWASVRGGSTDAYQAGTSESIDIVGDRTWYAQYKKIGYNVNGTILALSPLSSTVINYTNSDLYCKSLNTGGVTGWRLPTYTETDKLCFLVSNLHFAKHTNLWTSTEGAIANTHVTIYNNLATFDKIDRNDTSYTTQMYARCVRNLN